MFGVIEGIFSIFSSIFQFFLDFKVLGNLSIIHIAVICVILVFVFSWFTHK